MKGRAMKWAVRFFAAMMALTIFSRGMAGTARTVVQVQKPSGGHIRQTLAFSGTVASQSARTVELPAGILISTVRVAQGQEVKEGDTLLKLDASSLKTALKQAKAEQEQLEIQLETLTEKTETDDSAVSSAKESYRQAKEDQTSSNKAAALAVSRAKEDVSDAKKALKQARKKVAKLEDKLEAARKAEDAEKISSLKEELQAAKEEQTSAQEQLRAAKETLSEAKTSASETKKSAARSVKEAKQAVSEAEKAYASEKKTADRTDRQNAAEAEAQEVALQSKKETVTALQKLSKADGILTAPCGGTVGAMELTAGSETTGTGIVLETEGDGWVLTLTGDDISKLASGDLVTVSQGDQTDQVEISSVSQDEEGETSALAVLTGDGWKSGGASAEVVLSDQAYDTTVPLAACHEDNEGTFVYVVEETETVLGLQEEARRVSVEVLASDSEKAAVNGALESDAQVIVSSKRSISDGDAVSLKEDGE